MSSQRHKQSAILAALQTTAEGYRVQGYRVQGYRVVAETTTVDSAGVAQRVKRSLCSSGSALQRARAGSLARRRVSDVTSAVPREKNDWRGIFADGAPDIIGYTFA